MCETFKGKSLEERTKIVKEARLCFNCFSNQHSVKYCKSTQNCRQCGKRHHTLIHRELAVISAVTEPVTKPVTTPVTELVTTEPVTQATSTFVKSTELTRIALPVVAVRVRPPGSDINISTYALLDPGSTNTFCSSKLMKMLNLKGHKTSLTLTTMNGTDSIQQTEVVSLDVSDVYGYKTVNMPKVLSRPNLPINANSISTVDDCNLYPHLQGIDLPNADISEVLLLIGQDNPEALMPQQIIKGNRNEPYATRSVLGWSLNGPLVARSGTHQSATFFISAQISNNALSTQVEQFWKCDMHGLADEQRMSINDNQVADRWWKTTRLVDGHYKMNIPFKDNEPQLPHSETVAEVRLHYLKRKLEKNEPLKKAYTDTKVNDVSLNSRVHHGPDVTNKLIGVLLRFRQNAVVLTAKLNLQELCRQKLGWDNPIPLQCKQEWDKWINDLHCLQQVKTERCLGPLNITPLKFQLHHFSDSSMKAYGVVSYLLIQDVHAHMSSRIIMALDGFYDQAAYIHCKQGNDNKEFVRTNPMPPHRHKFESRGPYVKRYCNREINSKGIG